MKLILIFLCFIPSLLSGRTIVVDKTGKVTTLKQALTIAASGDTIVVKAGTYQEGNVQVTKSVTIIGEGTPVFDGEDKHEIFTITSDNVTVKGMMFVHTGRASMNDVAAIKVLDSRYVTIDGNRFEEAFFGIHFSNTSHSVVKNNILHASALAEFEIGNGIHMWKCDQITIDSNEIHGHRDGIYFEFVTNSLIRKNISEGNVRYGLHFMFSHNDEYLYNRFINNGAGVAVMYTRMSRCMTTHLNGTGAEPRMDCY
jgi:nitrous oxidase accessory protein